jgi:hypothetical protein
MACPDVFRVLELAEFGDVRVADVLTAERVARLAGILDAVDPDRL